MKQRVDSIDIARGMAMLLVIIQHCGAFSQFILSFHMPLFFMVSGLVVSGNKPNLSFGQDLKKNAQRLLIPQLTLGFLECLFIIVSTFYYEHRFELLGFNEVVNAILRWWFLLVLFLCRVLLWVIKKYVFGTKIKEIITLIALAVLSVFVYIIPGHLNELPVYMNLVPICLLFILVGYYAKGLLLKEMKLCSSVSLLVLLFITIIISQVNSKVSMYSYDLGNGLLFLLSSVCGSFFFIKIATLIRGNLLRWIGVMCMPIYVLQFHVVQYSMAVEATMLDYIECEDMVIKTTVLIALTVTVCCLLTNIISKSMVLSYVFGVSK